MRLEFEFGLEIPVQMRLTTQERQEWVKKKTSKEQ